MAQVYLFLSFLPQLHMLQPYFPIKYTFVGTMFAFRRVPTADAFLMHFISVFLYVFIIFQSKREEIMLDTSVLV